MLRQYSYRSLVGVLGFLAFASCRGPAVGVPLEGGAPEEAGRPWTGEPTEAGSTSVLDAGTTGSSGGGGEGRAGDARAPWTDMGTGGIAAIGDGAISTVGGANNGGAGGARFGTGGSGAVSGNQTGGRGGSSALSGGGAGGVGGTSASTGHAGGGGAMGGTPEAGGAGSNVGGGGVGSDGGTPCIEGTTEGDCSTGRRVCSGGQWVGDRTCFSSLCSMVRCSSTSSTCCQGWGRVGVSAANEYHPDETIVTSFGIVGSCVRATFNFRTPNDIGAITLYLSSPIDAAAVSGARVQASFSGQPTPTPEVSFELQSANVGTISWLYEADLGLYETDPYELPSCFLTGCPKTTVDLVNIRLRPYGMRAGDSGEATLEVCSVDLYY